ncbi:MAG: tRNA (adenosine(37)-N6)-threonylcarbamoyltransferase complex dimerization subunit type 1 TsaB [Bacteroidia bacterium]|nr:MAG: tRNA (adenosine(37)-N6)-threonylcarbamoyltransferase complex dimerization subunit type 1 TsaB [Bacteroidia bacterium]
MTYILLIETSTRTCSVGLLHNEKLLAIREDDSKNYSHSKLLAVFIREVLQEAGISPTDVSAVAVSRGPGSYTGLRIGVSAAKGFCFARDIPMIAVDTLKALTNHAMQIYPPDKTEEEPHAQIIWCPMIDARRMEVYYALFSQNLEEIRTTTAEVITEKTFEKELASYTMVFFGDGAEKCMSVFNNKNALFLKDVYPSVKGMVEEALTKFQQRDFVDTAYFEPFYLKDFVAGKPKVKGLYS